MAGGSKRQLVIFLSLFIAFLFVDCANQLPPGGGDVDKTPPTIIEVFPEDGTTNFSDDYFELGFSEYVEKRSVKEAIFISPAIEGELELDWSGKYVRVYFPGNLKQNVTYVVTIGTDVADYNNRNQMSQPFSFVFSTGAEIDRRKISGKVFDDKPQGVMIFGYLLKNEEDSLLSRKPDYISQSSASGNFELAGLAAGTYRVFSVRDEFRDLLYQPDQDEIGIPYRDVVLSDSDTLFSGLDFYLTKIDTTKPRMLSASMTDRHHILANFSEELDHNNLKAYNFYLFDSTENKRYQIKYAYKGNTKAAEIVLVPNELLSMQNSLYLIADTIKDKNGNIFLNDISSLTVSDRVDTAKTELFKAEPLNGSNEVDYLNSKFTFVFNDAFDAVKAKDGITFTDTLKRKIPFSLDFTDDASFVITPINKLEMSKDYLIKIDLSKFADIAGNRFDSVFTYKIKTITGLEFTGVTGRLINYDQTKNIKLELKNIEKKELTHSTPIDKSGQFNFERILPGKYTMIGYYDDDSSGTYSKGNIFPFQKSEEFNVYPDTLNLRARWIETDVKFFFAPQ